MLRMQTPEIICKPTRDTFVRFFIVLAALLGFGVYFFYDGAVGYRRANLAYFACKSFAVLGEVAESGRWEQDAARAWLSGYDGDAADPAICVQQKRFPLPPGTLRSLPDGLNADVLRRGWNESWTEYSRVHGMPIKPAEHPYDVGAIREQWYAGGVCLFLATVLLYFVLRTRSRVLALQGDVLTVAGQHFRVDEIERIDLRQWGPGFKGVAFFTVGGRRLRADGMTYGGFNAPEEPAEKWMKAVLEKYRGEIIEYAGENKTNSGV